MDLQIKWLQDFLQLSKSLNFSQAAHLRHVSQPAFSRRIQTLESHLNCKLVNRLSQPIKLTEQGVLFSQTCQLVLTNLEQGINKLRVQNSNIELKFAASHCLSMGVFPVLLQHMDQLSKKITSKLKVADADDSVDLLINHQCHYLLAFSDSLLSAKHQNSLLLGKVKLLPVCKANDLGLPIFSLSDDILDEKSVIPYLAYQKNIHLGRVVEKIINRNRAYSHFNKNIESSMADGLKMMALKGLGIAWIPEFSIRGELSNKQLAICGDKQWQEELEVRIYRNNQEESDLDFVWDKLAKLQI